MSCTRNGIQVCKRFKKVFDVDVELRRDRYELDTRLELLKEFVEAVDQRGDRWE